MERNQGKHEPTIKEVFEKSPKQKKEETKKEKIRLNIYKSLSKLLQCRGVNTGDPSRKRDFPNDGVPFIDSSGKTYNVGLWTLHENGAKLTGFEIKFLRGDGQRTITVEREEINCYAEKGVIEDIEELKKIRKVIRKVVKSAYETFSNSQI